MELRGLHCIVTGATQGIGRAIAVALGNEGARLSVCARTHANVQAFVEELARQDIAAGGGACDVADEGSVTSFVEAARSRFGPVDVLVNNAGLAYFVPVEHMSTEDFDATLAVNVRGVFLMTRAVLAEMVRRERGHVVNIASLAGRNPVPGAAAYAASKHAVLGFSKSLFGEIRKQGIRVTAICPGSVVTPFFEKSGAALERPDQKLHADDVAAMVLAALRLPNHALVSELDIRPTNP
jgi:3-oxoacyl-[acyl-carrier protein] reductase